MRVPRAIVVHAGRRDQYQLALALSEAHLLESLVTDFFWSVPDSLRPLIQSMVSRRAWEARSCRGLSSAQVHVSPEAVLLSALARLRPSATATRRVDAALSSAAARRAGSAQAALLCYSYYGLPGFAETTSPFRFLFQLHPHPRVLKNLFLEESERVPAARASLWAEHELALSGELFDVLARESELANGWLAASSFTRLTLEQAGIPEGRTCVVPYGVDASAFPSRPFAGHRGPLRVLFVGSFVQRKGLSYLVDAAGELRSNQVEVTLVGRGAPDAGLMAQIKALGIAIRPSVTHHALVQAFHEHDVFVLPSLAEGFGHVILEAMSCGLPVITTPNTCGPDVLREGVDGFIVPIRDAAALAAKLEWCAVHPEQLREMGRAAAESARQWTWERFREGIRSAYRNLCFRAAEVPSES